MLIDTEIIRARIRDLEARIQKGGDPRVLAVVRAQLADSREELQRAQEINAGHHGGKA